jgi:zinc D-Ala-D-Ala carboxypeptidase
MATWLSPHFALEELIATQHRQYDNRPPPNVRQALGQTAQQMEAVRQLLGNNVVSVSSGYRCPELNRAIGGAANSAHIRGRAVDFSAYSFGSPLAVCRAIAASDLAFDQLIEEGRWTHIAFDPAMRRQVLTKSPHGGYDVGLT